MDHYTYAENTSFGDFNAVSFKGRNEMVKRALVVAVAITGLSLFVQHEVYAQSNSVLIGSFPLTTLGSAELSAPTSGTCEANDTVAAGLFDTTWNFDGNGNVRASTLGISIGATSCTSINYNISGTYTVEQVGQDTFKARGMFSTRFVGGGSSPARCGATSLQNVPFSIVGTLAAGFAESFTITTDGVGEGSSYAESEPRGTSTTCTADILNFITSGTGRKFR